MLFCKSINFYIFTVPKASKIRPEQVWAAAQALVDEGRKPTLEAIRRRLGGGSYTTLSRHLADWREKQRPAPELPPPPESVVEVARRLWAEAWRLAGERLDEARARWAAERQALEQEIADLSRELDRKEEALREVTARLEEAVRRQLENGIAREYHRTEGERLARERDAALERLRVLERENAALVQKTEDLAGEIARLYAELAAARRRKIAAPVQAACLEEGEAGKRGDAPGRTRDGDDSA